MSGPSSAASTSAAQLLSGERVLVCDGAMGTMLHAAGAALDRSLPELNLSDPGLVATIHDSYLTAGVDIIQANTFGANRLWLADHGFPDKVAEINRAGRPARARAAADRAGPPRPGGRVGVAGGDRAAAPPRRRRRADGGAARADTRPGRRRRRRPADPGDVRVPGRARRGGLGGRVRHQPAADRAGHVRRRRAHPRRRDAARGRRRAVLAAGRGDRHQLHDRPAADAGRRRGPRPLLRGAGQRPAERRAAAPHRAALVRVRHRRRLLLPVPDPVRRRRRDAGRRLLRHHADAHQGRRRGAAHAVAGPSQAAGARHGARSGPRSRSRPAASGPARSPTTWRRAGSWCPPRSPRPPPGTRATPSGPPPSSPTAASGSSSCSRGRTPGRTWTRSAWRSRCSSASAWRRSPRSPRGTRRSCRCRPTCSARTRSASARWCRRPGRRRCSATTRRSTAPGRSTRSG